MKLPESEIKRQKTKRQREKERKQRRAEEERAKEAERKRKREEEAQEHEDEEKSKKDKKKKKKKEKKEKEEERSKARGSAASARQSSSFNPSKGRMGGSTWRKENFIDLKLLRKFHDPRMDLNEGENWTRVDLIVDSGASDSTLPIGVLPGHQIGEVRGYKEFAMADGRILPNLGTKKLQMAISVWTCHDWYIQCG